MMVDRSSVLLRLFKYLNKNKIVMAEIGVHRGFNAKNLLNKYTNLELYLIDPYKEYDYNDPHFIRHNQNKWDVLFHEITKTFENDNRVTILRKTSVEASNLFQDEYFDIVFIDGNHSYEAVKQDILSWFPKVKYGGVISGHDYSKADNFLNKNVVRAVHEILGNNIFLENDKVWWITKNKGVIDG